MLDKVCQKILKKTETREADSSKFPIRKHKNFDEFGFYFEMFSLLFWSHHKVLIYIEMISQHMSTEKLQFKRQGTSLYVVSAPYKTLKAPI